jgi:signal transduction histidine kinase
MTELGRAEELLRRKQSELTEAHRLAAIGSWHWDRASGTVTWSQELFRLAGRDPTLPAVSYEQHPELYSLESWNRLRAAVDTCLQTGAPYELLLEMICAEGSRRWVTARGEVERGSTGDIIGLRGTVQDITARKHAEEALSNHSRRLLEAQEAERARIARELHDDIGQRLTLLSMALQQLQQSGDSASELRRSIAALARQATDIATDVQTLSHELHSYKLQLLGVVAAIRDICSVLSVRHRLEVEFTHRDVPGTVRPDIALCLFRVAQEALQNAVRHSGARHFAVSLEGTPAVLTLTVRDGGSGFKPESLPRDPGLGLTSMRERLKVVSGELVIDSKSDSGTTVVARVPLHEARPLTE